jgi:hypothetical protein
MQVTLTRPPQQHGGVSCDGRSVRILRKFVDVDAVGFPQSASVFSYVLHSTAGSCVMAAQARR